MGYQTQFKGAVKFTRELTARELAYLKGMFWLDEDDFEKGGYIVPAERPHYIQYELTEDFDGIQWDGSEKFYKAVEAMNFIIVNMKAKFPDFGLTGRMTAQGEEFDDRWELVIGEDGMAHEVRTPPAGTVVKCPHCEEKFVLDAAA